MKICWIRDEIRKKEEEEEEKKKIEINNTKPVKEVIFLNGEILKILKENKYT